MNSKNPTESIAAAQAQSVEQALAYSRAAAASFERLTRQHYAMVGDLVDYTLAQLHVPSDSKDPRAVLEAQAENARELAEKTRSRMEEYAQIATTMRDLAGSSVSSATPAGSTTGSRQDTPASKADAGGTPAAKPASASAKPDTSNTQKEEKIAAPTKPAAEKPAAKRVAKAAAKPAMKTVKKTVSKPVTGTRAKKKAASRKG